jgi:hypothetical protein
MDIDNLAKEVRVFSQEDDCVSCSLSLQRWATAVDGIPSGDRWNRVLKGVVPLELPINWITEWKDGMQQEENLYPISQNSIPPEYVKQMLTRLTEEGVVGGYYRTEKMAMALRSAMGMEAFTSNYFIRLLKAHHNFVNDPDGAFGCYVTARGTLRVTQNPLPDILALKRASVLLESAHMLHNAHSAVPREMKEVGLYIALDPFHHFNDVKKITGTLDLLAFSLNQESSLERVCKWERTDAGPRIATDPMGRMTAVPLSNLSDDRHLVNFIKRALSGISKYEEKMPIFFGTMRDLISTPLTKSALDKWIAVRGIGHCAGFIRARRVETARRQIAGATGTKVLDLIHPIPLKPMDGWALPDYSSVYASEFHRSLYHDWSSMLRDAPTWSQDHALLEAITGVQNKSAGSGPVTIQLDKGMFAKGGSIGPTSVKSTSKPLYLAVAMTSDQKLAHLVNPSTLNMLDAKFGFRVDRIRKARTISMMPIAFHLVERAFANAMYRAQAKHPWPSISKTDNRSFGNFTNVVVAQTDPYNTMLLVATDADTMDGNTKYAVLGPRFQACIEAAMTMGKGDFYGYAQVKDVPGMVAATMDYARAYLAPRFSARDPIDGETFLTQLQLLSGDFLTAATHNQTNITIFKMYNRLWLPKFLSILALPDHHVDGKKGDDSKSTTGDDTLQIFRILSLLLFREKFDDILASLLAIAARSTIPFNFTKTMLRTRLVEYLKKTFLYGMAIPLTGRSTMFDREMSNYHMDMPELVSAFQSTCIDLVTRHSDPDFTRHFLFFLCANRLRMKSRTIQATVPAILMFMPRSMGGFGLYYTDPFHPSSDDAMMYSYKARCPNTWKEMCQLAPGAKKIVWSRNRTVMTEVSSALEDAARRSERLYNRKRVEVAKAAETKLASFGYSANFLANNRYDRGVRTVINSKSRSTELLLSARSHSATLLAKEISTLKRVRPMDPLPSYFRYLSITIKDFHRTPVIDSGTLSPLPGWRARLDTIARFVGPGPSDRSSSRLWKALNQIPWDRNQNLTSEMLLEKLVQVSRDTLPANRKTVMKLIVELVAGAPPSGNLIEMIASQGPRLMAEGSFRGWSTSDSIFSELDISDNNLQKWTSIEPYIPSKGDNYPRDQMTWMSQMSLFLQLGFFLCLYHPNFPHVACVISVKPGLYRAFA